MGGEERRKKQPAKQASKLPQKPFLFVIKKGVTYLFFFYYLNFFLSSWPARKTRREGCESGENGRAERARKSEKSEEKRLGEAQAHERQAERGINERGGEGRQGGRQL